MATGAAQQPNIVYIDAHDLGDWLACYGRPYLSTPHLDQLASEGALFSQYIATAPICMPSRSAIYTGHMPHVTGVTGQFPLNSDEICLPMHLAKHGYETVLIGSVKVLNSPTWMGFERTIPVADRTLLAQTAADYLYSQRGQRNRPLHVFVSFQAVHRPYQNTFDPAVAESMLVPSYLPNLPVVSKDLATLAYRVGLLDEQLGLILNAVKAAGLQDTTLLLFTTDHGIAVARAKHTLYDAGLKVALITKYPPLITPGSRYDDLLSNVDLLPTVLEIAGAPVPDGLHGSSFLRLLQGRSYESRSECFSEQTWGRRAGMQYYSPSRSIRSKGFKYIYNFSERPFFVDTDWLARLGSDRAVVEDRWGQPAPEEELYDLYADQYELHNLARDPVYAKARSYFHNTLFSFLERTQDPILRGPIPNVDGLPDIPLWVRQSDGSYTLRDCDPKVGSDAPFPAP